MIDFWSAATISVIPYANSVALSHGTAFTVVSRRNRRFLITNYHVAAGRHPDTNAPIRKDGVLPDRLLFVRYAGETDSGHCWKPLVLPTEQGRSPSWFMHPQHGATFDVVAIPVSNLVVGDAIPAVPIGPWPRIAIRPGSDVAIIGFPEGITGAGAFPLWKTGGVASEPELPIPKNDFSEEDDFFWIDSNTRSGMSGAPVIARRLGMFLDESGGNVASGQTDRLLGVYAGRALDAKDVTLGRVWRLRGLEALIENADEQLDKHFTTPRIWRIGHTPSIDMPTIENFKLNPTQNGVPIDSNEHVSEIILSVLNGDHRFGLGIERVKIAARLESACANAKTAGTAIEIDAPAAALLIDALNQPVGWTMPPTWKTIVADLERLIQALSELVNNH